MTTEKSKKTPADVTEFEREQLRFFMTMQDVPAVLAEINPSIAWLPILAELNLVGRQSQLAPWIEKNFADTDAVREVAASIRFFDAETARLLEFRLNQASGLSPVLMTSWRLIIRHMQMAKRDLAYGEWFDIQPRIKRGEHVPDLIERLAEALRPKIRIGKRVSWGDEKKDNLPERPSDLMAIDFEIAEGITDEEVLASWPFDASAKVDASLLILLTNALNCSLAEAMEAGVESNTGYSTSDSDVPSVAKHRQNSHRSGFLPIVRITAEIWSRLIQKDVAAALRILEQWRDSPYRLMRRLALFAVADRSVPTTIAADLLTSMPSGELFLTNSSVEVYRLISARWNEFTPNQRRTIEDRITAGPPANWFPNDNAKLVDRCRFDLLGHMKQAGLPLGEQAHAALEGVRGRWPKWQLKPQDQAGFHIWHESSRRIVGDPIKLDDVPDGDLVDAAKSAAAAGDFLDGDAWDALCKEDPLRSLRGLKVKSATNEWPVWAWRSFLLAIRGSPDSQLYTDVARLLLSWPIDDFGGIASDVSSWLTEAAKTLDESLLWPLWDRIVEVLTSLQDNNATVDDAFSAAINHPAGRLAEILAKKLPSAENSSAALEALRERLDRLVHADGQFGFLARVWLSAEVSYLFQQFPEWTKSRIVPLFDWSSPDASAAWSARKYSNYIGPPELFGLTEKPFFELFKRPGISAEQVQIFSEWLTAIMIANQVHQAGYPVTSAEARSALRQAGTKSLSNVAHRLAVELERASSKDKIDAWRNVVGPVFRSIWPLDLELQTPATTFKLVQILRASGSAFPEAVEVIIPFIRPDDPHLHTSVYSISNADDILYSSSPDRALDLILAVVGDGSARNAYGLGKALERIRAHAPHLVNTRKFQRLAEISSRDAGANA